MIKKCVICGNFFETNHPLVITCSKECSLENRKRKEKAYRQKTAAEKGKKLYNKICKVCNKPFQTYNSCQTICSSECRTIAERERQKLYEQRRREGYYQKEEEQEQIDHKYDWLRKFDPIIKECIRTGMSYGRTVARKER